MVPALALPPAVPSTVQATAVLPVPVTVAVMAALAPVERLIELGLTDTATEGLPEGWTVTTVVADWVASASLVATMLWLPAAGAV